MMDEDDFSRETSGEKSSTYKDSLWRPQITGRLLARAKLLLLWLRRTVWPKFGLRVLIATVVTTCGSVLEAASFFFAAHSMTTAFSQEGGVMDTQSHLATAGLILVGLVGLASLTGYFGYRYAVRIVLDYETDTTVEGMSILQYCKQHNIELTEDDSQGLVRTAPRMMSRTLLQIINLGTSFIIMCAGFFVCFLIFPALVGLISLALLMISPLYVVAAIRSTGIGHRVRIYGREFGRATKRALEASSKEPNFDAEAIAARLKADSDYVNFHRAYGDRLTLASTNRLLTSLTFSVTVVIAFAWIMLALDLNGSTVGRIIGFFVFLRLFAKGLTGVFNGFQVINTFIPFYLTFLKHYPRPKAVIS
jgi:ABC-type multidrug transport system fused ATPase/permease subunit